MEPIIFYELVLHPGSPICSPNTWKTRLSLLEKRCSFETRELTGPELAAKGRAWGMDRPRLPTIELPDGKIITDSFRIAEWLDETYSDRPSLFDPTAPLPLDLSSPEREKAVDEARVFADSFGSTGAFFELVARELEANITDPSFRSYFTSDAKLGGNGTWGKIMSLNRDEMLARTKKALLPLEERLRSSPFMTGQLPSFIDFVVYGRWAIMSSLNPATANAVWKERDCSLVKDWIERIEARYAEDLKDVLARNAKI